MKRTILAGTLPLLALLSAAGTPPALQATNESESTYARTIAPILEASCAKCHGPKRQKGGLALDSSEAILKGGDTGFVLKPGNAAESELLSRIALPLEDVDHMPPEGQPQPSAEDVALLTAWIAQGASFEEELDLAGVPAKSEPAKSEAEPKLPPLPPAPPPNPAALEALSAVRIHVEPLAVDRNELWVDGAAVAAELDDERTIAALSPLTEQIVELDLARSRIGAGTLRACRTMPRLERLNLRSTKIDDSSLALLNGHERLRELVLADTRLTAGAVSTLKSLPNLRRLYVWNAGLPSAALAELRSARPKLVIDAGVRADAAVLEVEPEPRFQRGSQDSAGRNTSKPAPKLDERLAPINSDCPVSGSPVDARYLVVHENQVVGFCCSNCPKTFWTDPAKFTSKLATESADE